MLKLLPYTDGDTIVIEKLIWLGWHQTTSITKEWDRYKLLFITYMHTQRPVNGWFNRVASSCLK